MRLKRILKKFVLIFVLSLLVCSNAYSEGRSLDNENTFEILVGSVNKKYDLIKTMSTHIIKTSEKEGEIRKEEWNFYSKKPFQIKVEYLKPHKRLLALDNDKFVEYIPEIKEARITDLSGYDHDKKIDFIENAFSRVVVFGLRLGDLQKGEVKITGTKYEGHTAIYIEGKKPNHHIWIEVDHNALLKHTILDDEGKIVYSTAGSGFKLYNGKFLFPHKINAIVRDSHDGKEIKSETHLDNLKINKNIDDSVFELILPDDVKITNN